MRTVPKMTEEANVLQDANRMRMQREEIKLYMISRNVTKAMLKYLSNIKINRENSKLHYTVYSN